MAKSRKPLKRSILTGTVVFILLMCLILSVEQFFSYRKMLYSRYEVFIESILRGALRQSADAKARPLPGPGFRICSVFRDGRSRPLQAVSLPVCTLSFSSIPLRIRMISGSKWVPASS